MRSPFSPCSARLVLTASLLLAVSAPRATAQDSSAGASTFTTQPARLEPYERTPLHAMLQGYVLGTRSATDADGNSVDIPLANIGDRVAEGEVLAVLSVPELDEELRQKQALAEQAREELAQASAAILVAEKAVQSAEAMVEVSKAGVVRAEGESERWRAEHDRTETLASRGSVSQKLVDEARGQLAAARAGDEEARARVSVATADLAEATAAVAKARADESVERAHVKVAEADVARTEALLGYARVRSPFAGVVTRRGVDTGHFVQPGGATATPLFVVERVDILRVVVDVPERDAPLVHVGNSVRLRIPALGEGELTAAVSRTGWSLDPASRSLRVEIDLPNPDRRYRPGMYAKAEIELRIAAPTGQEG